MNISFHPDWNAPTKPLRHTWAGVGNIDQFRWLVRDDVRRQLAMARDELGLRHVRACAMYSPELRVWTHALGDWRKPPAERQLGANWQTIDYCIEGLLELGLKPIYTTCFTPAAFTDSEASCWPDGNRISPPRDLAQWAGFVTEGVRHHLKRFGAEEVRSWYFEVWNEPNLSGFWAGTKEEFFKFWSVTYRAIKAADPMLRVGGPSTARGEWVPEFLDWTKQDGTTPDYLITHVYNNDSESEPLSPFDGLASHRVKDSPHFASGVIRGLRRELDTRGWKGEVHWNEWGRSWFPHDPLKETALEAAFVVKTMAEASQEADAFAFWCLSDIYDQCGVSASEFDGNYGLLSLHGLRKPAYQAHVLLQRLGGERVPVSGGDALTGSVATREHGGAVLIYTYPETLDAPLSNLEVRVSVPSGVNSKAINLIRLGSVENNIVATWRMAGAHPYPTSAALAALRAANALQPAPTSSVRIENGFAVFTMERPGVALLTSMLPK